MNQKDYKACKCGCTVFMLGTEKIIFVQMNQLEVLKEVDKAPTTCEIVGDCFTCTECCTGYTLEELRKL